MKIKLTTQMRQNIYVGIAIATFTLTLYYLLNHFRVVSNVFHTITAILFPFIVGFFIAFLLNPIVKLLEDKVFYGWKNKKIKRSFCVILSLFIGFAIVLFLIYLVVPSVINSIGDLISHNEDYIMQYTSFITDLFSNLNLDSSHIDELVGTGSEFLDNFGNVFTKTLPTIVSTSYGLIKLFFDLIIGIVASVFLLIDKENFIQTVKKINFAILPHPIAQYLRRMVNVMRKIFYDFIVGKAIDSLIIGIICYIGLMILDIKYASLLSVIVGITNMIPVFGPFIGAIPGILLLLILDPIKAVTFAIFILVLQQFDGNILGPLILGDKLGLPSFFVLFSVTIGGALFGIVGMFFGAPTFAVIYFGIKEYVEWRLEMKNNLPDDIQQKKAE